uniref:Uncharacterized protein n=1 Tax=Oryza nivara TaxID=4536 RepID=A0A0E0FZ12_ORYNI
MATPGHRQHALTARLAAAPRPACAVELLSPRRARSFRRVREAEPARLVRAVAASPAWPLVNVVGGEHVAAMMTAVGARPEEYLEELGKVAKLAAGFNLVDLFPESRLVRAAQAAHEKDPQHHGRLSAQTLTRTHTSLFLT